MPSHWGPLHYFSCTLQVPKKAPYPCNERFARAMTSVLALAWATYLAELERKPLRTKVIEGLQTGTAGSTCKCLKS